MNNRDKADYWLELCELLDTLKPLQIEARYPEHKERTMQSLSEERCVRLIRETEEFLCWIKNRLEN